MIIVYKGADQHSLSAGPAHRVTLNPGRNKVDPVVWEKIEDAASKEGVNGGLNVLKEKGMLKVLDAEQAVENDVIDVSRMNQPEAIELIENEVEAEALYIYLEQESTGKNRPKVITAIEDRAKILESEDGAAD